jgi:hypothetical protein
LAAKIIAADEMLEALEKAEAFVRGQPELHGRVCSAILKAKGRDA